MKKFLSILLAMMMVLSTVSFAAPSLVVTQDSAVEVPVDALYEVEEEAALAAELSEDTDSYGELIFEINFDNLTSVDSQKINLKDAGWINPEFDYTYNYLTEKAAVSFSAWPTYALKERAAGNKYLELAGGTGYAVVLIESGTERGFQGKDGIYTLTADVYTPDAMPLTTRFTASSSEDTPIQDFSAINNAGWGKMILQHDPSCYGNGGHATPMTSAKEVKTIKFHRNGGTDNKTVGYDNIKLYYKPLEVNVTLKFEGKSVTKKVSTANPVLVADLTKYLDLGIMYSTTGAKIGDKTYTPDEYISFGKDTTVEITAEKLDSKYVSDTHGLMIFDIDFEKAEIGTDIPKGTSDFGVSDYATPIGKKVMSHDPSNWQLVDDGFDLKVMADPVNANNKVAGITGATSTGYPVLQLTTWSDGAAARYGFIEDDDLIWTVVYDYYDTTADGVAIRFGGKTSREDIEYNGQFHPKWTTFEDGPVESNTGRAASTWYSNIGVMTAEKYDRMGGSDEISFLKMHAASPENADIYYDNIRLYYKPAHVDVSFNANGVKNVVIANETLENVTSTGIKVSDLLAQAGVDYSNVSKFAHAFKGVAFDAEGTKVYGLNDTISFYENCTLYLIFEDVDMTGWQDENGILLYEINLNNLANGTVISNGALISSFGRVNPYVEGSENWYLNISQFSDATVVDGALKFEKTAGGQWAQIQISNEKNNPAILISDGTITKFADMKIVSDVSGVTLGLTGYARKYNTSTGKWEGTTNNQNSVKTLQTVEAGKWYSLTGSKTLEGQEYNSESCTIFLPTYPATGGIGDTFYLDNLKMYWKPANVNITVYGGSNADYETVDLTRVSTVATVEDVIALLPGSAYGKITGLADMEGNRVTSLNLSSDASFVAIWTPWTVIEGGQEFLEDKKGVPATSMWKSGGYAYQADVGDGGADTTTAVHNMYGNAYWSENGNFYRTLWTPQIGDADIGEGDTADTVQTFAIPAGRTHFNPKLNGGKGDYDCIRENIKVNLAAANDAEYILVKYRYTGLPNLAEVVANCKNPEGYEYTLSADGYTINYTDRWGDAASATLKPSYGAKYYVEMQNGGYEYAGGLEFRQNELMVEGEWLYDMIPVTEKIATNGAMTVLVQHENIFHNEVIEFDYIRFVKMSGEEEDVVLPDLGGDAPAVKLDKPTTFEETSLRFDGDNLDRNGIRFQAAVTAKADEQATTIGFVVAAESKFSTDYPYSKLDVYTSFAKVGYKRLDGVELTNYFDISDDNALVISAVLKGIDEDHYDSLIVARPFVAVDGQYVYGDTVVTSLYDECAKIYCPDPENPNPDEISDEWLAICDTNEDLASFIEDVVYIVNEW